jgi:hypothetical protein
VITGDLSFVENNDLRTLLSYGTSYRIPKSNNWNKIYQNIRNSINDCITTWSNKEHVDRRIFNEWKNTFLTYVSNKIKKLRKKYNKNKNTYDKTMYANSKMVNLLNNNNNNNVKECLKQIHDDYVIVNADKASNNIIIICKKYYLQCMRDELGMNNDDNNGNETYERIHETNDDIINKHKKYMNDNKIAIPIRWMRLPKLYNIPKMHKTPPKQRFIAASNMCTTKPISNIITKCLKLILAQHRKYCNTIYHRTKVNMMWIVDNNKDVLNTIDVLNDNKNAKNVNTYDFSTLYTKIQHDDLKAKMKWIIDKAYYNHTKQFIYVPNNPNINATWNKRNNATKISKDKLIEYIEYLIDNIYITVGQNTFRQIIGIPMGTDCAPYIANLYLYALEYAYLKELMSTDLHMARKISMSYRYIDDLIMFNSNGIMDEHKTRIYPPELILNKENKKDNNATFLDINIKINDNNKITTSIYDKRDDFNFTINNYPNLSGNIHAKRTHGMVISQLLRYGKICNNVNDFIHRSKMMMDKLIKQYFVQKILRKKVSNFYDKYYHIIQKYNLSKYKMINTIFT